MKHTVEVMIPEAEIKARIAELGRQITERYKDSGSDMVLVGLLRGSFMFMADLCREVQVSHEVDFMTASSYGSGMSTTRDVKILKDLDEDIRGKDVLIVEDIIDSGNTLSKVREILSLREPKSLAICTLLDKPSRREVNADLVIPPVLTDRFLPEPVAQCQVNDRFELRSPMTIALFSPIQLG